MTTTPDLRTWMTSSPRTVTSKTTLRAAYDAMTMNAIHHLPVVDDGLLVGLVDDRVLLSALHFDDARHMTVDSVMTREPFAVDIAEPVVELARVMKRDGHRVAVVRENGRVAGIFTLVDALRLVADGA